ncbi:MAG: LptE family protein [Candidatus Korobacteraceae bacterium]
MSDHSVCRRVFLTWGAALLLLTTACGYHTAGTAVRLPSDLHTVYVPAFSNMTQAYNVGQIFTEAVIKELRSRTNYRIVTVNDGTADATLSGMITSVFSAPLTYDNTTGAITSSIVVLNVRASLTARDGKVLWSDPNFLYREQYQESNDTASFFEEATPAIQRIAGTFSKALVSNILEAY